MGLRCDVNRGIRLLFQAIHRVATRIKQNAFMNRARDDLGNTRSLCNSFVIIIGVALDELDHLVLVQFRHQNLEGDIRLICMVACVVGGI